MLKRVLSVIAGIAVFMGIVMLTDAVSEKIYPLPPGTDFGNKETLEAAIAALPLGASILMLIGQAIASFAGAAVATLASGRRNHLPAFIVGGIATLAGIANLMEIPHSIGFDITNVISYLPAAYLGYWVARKNK